MPPVPAPGASSHMNEEIVQLTERLVKIRQEIEQPGSTDLPRYLAASDIHGNVARLRQMLSTAKRRLNPLPRGEGIVLTPSPPANPPRLRRPLAP